MIRTADKLWHYTCHHSADSIDAAGVLLPNPHPWWPEPLVWLTDLDGGPAEALFGYPTGLLECDRAEARYRIPDPAVAVWWPRYCRLSDMPRRIREQFEDVPGGMSAHWWVALVPVPVVGVGVRL
jgi:hypothetical protein